MRMIDNRSADACDRLLVGHWEGDLLMGAGNRSAIGAVVERLSRFVILLHLDGRTQRTWCGMPARDATYRTSLPPWNSPRSAT